MYFKYSIRNFFIGLFPWPFELAENAKLFFHASKWRKNGFNVPLPNILKRSILLRELLAHKADVFVETGTFLGDTPWFLRKRVSKIITLEVHPPLAELATKRFRNSKNIKVIPGDSGSILAEIAASLEGKVLFWLDGHYSRGITGMSFEECPIFRELDAIRLGCKADWLILIDDARDFGAYPEYPSISQLSEYFRKYNIAVEINVENDIIRVRRVA